MLLVHDANVLIDLKEGDLLRPLFYGPWQVVTPNALFHRELATQHPELPDMGLQLLDVSGEWVLCSVQWAETYRQTSAMDRLCLALALQEECPIVTGDARLKKAAQAEGCRTFGTIWIVEQLTDNGLISITSAFSAYDAMEAAGSRLPFSDARRRLRAIRKV
ncbi:DUF3368 domain-containing protein [Algiphilus sp.]|uniref:DUF3368 domain-containing protein n=1 Tax=Algiphilus sp. TaxID=1872431 RepID=UPI0025C19610|nr:DUF3368 domain-containing protein [Algiphilus sp.]